MSKAEKLHHRQTAILNWLLALGHEVDDADILAEQPMDGLTRYLATKKETVRIGNTTVVFDD